MPYSLNKDYNSLDRIEKWDAETQDVIKRRIANELGDTFSYEFLTQPEGETLEILVDALIPQEKNNGYILPVKSRETGAEQFNRVKISEIIDRKLVQNFKGVRYGSNPWPQEFYKKGLTEFSDTAKKDAGKSLEDFSAPQLEKFIADIFKRNSDDFLRKFLRQVLSDATTIYFSHPASWNAIGFPGPAYPAGYPFLDCGEKEDWEPNYEK